MKTKALTLSVLAALAFSAQAADVTLYGVVDTGLSIQHRDYVGQSSSTVTRLASGQYIGSRWGIKGAEEVAPGVKVGFVLESGFGSDTGSLGQDGRLFGREARLYVEGDRIGLLSFGRMGPIVGGNGPYARFGHVANAFSCGWGDLGGSLQVVSLGYEFMDNVVAYTTPKFGNFDASFQYSFNPNTLDKDLKDVAVEGKSSSERMASGVVRYQDDALMVAFGLESINQAHKNVAAYGIDDSLSYNLGASYKTDFAKFFFYGQYFKDYAKTSKTTMFIVPSGIDGYGINIGADIPVMGGTMKVTLGRGDFEGSQKSELTMTTWQAAAGYVYPLSKTTSLYGAAGMIRNSYSAAYEALKPAATENVYEFMAGLVHKF